ncbi:MAG: iron transporter [Pseudomonadota bacterium]
MPAQLVRGHPPAHPEGQMHGGAPVGENHIMVALFEEKTGKRLSDMTVTATITGPGRFKAEKKLEPMVIADGMTYGNYFYMPGPGPYRIKLSIRLPSAARAIRATFTWARS